MRNERERACRFFFVWRGGLEESRGIERKIYTEFLERCGGGGRKNKQTNKQTNERTNERTNKPIYPINPSINPLRRREEREQKRRKFVFSTKMKPKRNQKKK